MTAPARHATAAASPAPDRDPARHLTEFETERVRRMLAERTGDGRHRYTVREVAETIGTTASRLRWLASLRKWPPVDAFRYWSARIVRRPCPRCGQPTAVGFDTQPEPLDQPAKCVTCTAYDMHADLCRDGLVLGYPLSEQGPCGLCRRPCHLYGPAGRPLCDRCHASRQPAG